MHTPSLKEAMDLILVHPDPDKQKYWAQMMTLALDIQLKEDGSPPSCARDTCESSTPSSTPPTVPESPETRTEPREAKDLFDRMAHELIAYRTGEKACKYRKLILDKGKPVTDSKSPAA